MIVPTDMNVAELAPALVLILFAMLALIADVIARRPLLGEGVAILAPITAALPYLVLSGGLHDAPRTAFGLQWITDGPAVALGSLILAGTLLAVLGGAQRVRRDGLDRPEYYPLTLLAAAGGLVMVHAGDLVVLLLGLEILSLAVYSLAAWQTGRRDSEEAGMKYFLLGAFASAVLIYGMALSYGATGAFDYAGIAAGLAGGAGPLAIAGSALILAGLAFKAAFVPFHQWAPDVYTGAPTPVTIFMSVVVKIAAFGALLRLFGTAWAGQLPWIEALAALLVAATLLVGTFGALLQSGLKRMLAYSAVAHAGFLGLAILASSTVAGAPTALAWYLAAYLLMNVGAFVVVMHVMGDDPRGDDIARFEGLGARRPGLAIAFSVFLLSLAGFPPLAGFVGKFLAIEAAVRADAVAIAVVAMGAAIVGALVYLRPVFAMWFRSGDGDAPALSGTTRFTVLACLLGTVLFGVMPELAFALLDRGAALVFTGLAP